MIRLCTDQDVQFLCDLTREFNDALYDVPLNPVKTQLAIETMVSTGLALRTDTSAIVGLFTDDPFRDRNLLVEVGWYAKDGQGLALLKVFECLAKEHNVDEIRMSTLDVHARAGLLLKRRGYQPLDHSWRLQLRRT